MKRLLIPAIAGALLLAGCSSGESAPAESTAASEATPSPTPSAVVIEPNVDPEAEALCDSFTTLYAEDLAPDGDLSREAVEEHLDDIKRFHEEAERIGEEDLAEYLSSAVEILESDSGATAMPGLIGAKNHCNLNY